MSFIAKSKRVGNEPVGHKRLQIDFARRDQGDGQSVVTGLSVYKLVIGIGMRNSETYTVSEGALHVELLDKEQEDRDLYLRCTHSELSNKHPISLPLSKS